MQQKGILYPAMKISLSLACLVLLVGLFTDVIESHRYRGSGYSGYGHRYGSYGRRSWGNSRYFGRPTARPTGISCFTSDCKEGESCISRLQTCRKGSICTTHVEADDGVLTIKTGCCSSGRNCYKKSRQNKKECKNGLVSGKCTFCCSMSKCNTMQLSNFSIKMDCEDWKELSTCTRQCGGGEQTRSRVCRNTASPDSGFSWNWKFGFSDPDYDDIDDDDDDDDAGDDDSTYYSGLWRRKRSGSFDIGLSDLSDTWDDIKDSWKKLWTPSTWGKHRGRHTHTSTGNLGGRTNTGDKSLGGSSWWNIGNTFTAKPTRTSSPSWNPSTTQQTSTVQTNGSKTLTRVRFWKKIRTTIMGRYGDYDDYEEVMEEVETQSCNLDPCNNTHTTDGISENVTESTTSGLGSITDPPEIVVELGTSPEPSPLPVEEIFPNTSEAPKGTTDLLTPPPPPPPRPKPTVEILDTPPPPPEATTTALEEPPVPPEIAIGPNLPDLRPDNTRVIIVP